jgi:hypothetical protein
MRVTATTDQHVGFVLPRRGARRIIGSMAESQPSDPEATADSRSLLRRLAGGVWYPFGVTVRFIFRNGKRIGVTIVGGILLLIGLVMMVTPGPGILLIIAGLAVLGTEYVWAQRALNYAKEKAQRAKDRVQRKRG